MLGVAGWRLWEDGWRAIVRAILLQQQHRRRPPPTAATRPAPVQALLWARKVRALLERMPGAEAPAPASPQAAGTQQPEQQQQPQQQAEQAPEVQRQPPLAPEAVLERWVAHKPPAERPAAAELPGMHSYGPQQEEAAVRDLVQRRLADGVAAACEGRLPWELRPPLSEAAALLEEGYILPCDEALYGRLMRWVGAWVARARVAWALHAGCCAHCLPCCLPQPAAYPPVPSPPCRRYVQAGKGFEARAAQLLVRGRDSVTFLHSVDAGELQRMLDGAERLGLKVRLPCLPACWRVCAEARRCSKSLHRAAGCLAWRLWPSHATSNCSALACPTRPLKPVHPAAGQPSAAAHHAGGIPALGGGHAGNRQGAAGTGAVAVC